MPLGWPSRGCSGALPPAQSRRSCHRRLWPSRCDDRQLIFLPPGSAPTLPGIPLADETYRVFPNVPYEEKKGVRRS